VNAQHSQKSMEHGTPAIGVELARAVLGRIDLDPASSGYWNFHSVRAARFFDRKANGLVQPWSGMVFVNPPGADEEGETRSLVRPFWERLVDHWVRGKLDGALWWGYSLEQLQMLQSSMWDPSKCVTLILGARPRHLVRPSGGGAPVEGESPTHSGYATLLPSRAGDIARMQMARFRERAARLGRVVRPM
jgi:hypothetical protein